MTQSFAVVLDPELSDNTGFRALADYWHRLRGVQPMPPKAAIDVLDLKAHVGSLMLLEWLPDYSDFRYRLIGVRIVEAYGRDSTGKTMRELYDRLDHDYCERVIAGYRAVSLQPAIGRCNGSLVSLGRGYRRFDSVMLPLARLDGNAGWVLAKVEFS